MVYHLEESSSSLTKNYEKLITQFSQKNLFLFINNLLMSAHKMNYQDYSQSISSSVIEDIIINHKQQCLKYPDCFCNFDNKTALDVWNNVISENKRKLFVLNYIDSLFNRQITETQRLKGKFQENVFNEDIVELKFIYINFLMNESKSKTMALYQIYLLQQEENQLRFRQQMYLSYLHSRVESHFHFLTEKSYQTHLNCLIIEERVKNLKDLYENCLLDKLELLNQLNSDHIHLETFQQHGLQLLEKKAKLEKFKKDVQKKWKTNNLVRDILPQIQKNLGFTLNMEQFYQISHQFFTRSKVLNYSTKATALVSFSNNNLGKIMKATKQFCKLFEIEQAEGVSIYDFIPQEFHKDHGRLVNDYLLGFSTDSTTSSACTNSSSSFVIAYSKKGFCLPLSIHFSVEYIMQFNSIGVFTTFTPTYFTSHFLIFDQNNQSIKSVTQNFYNTYLSQFIDYTNINSLEITSFIPSIKNILSENKMMNEGIISDIGILPTREYFLLQSAYKYCKLTEILSKSLINQNKFSLFKIQYQFRKFELIKNSKLEILEILSMSKISSEYEFQQQFNHLKNMISPKSQANIKDQSYPSTRSTSPLNRMPPISPINNIVFSQKLKQMQNELQELFPIKDQSEEQDLEYDEEEQSQLDFVPNSYRISQRNNLDITHDSFAYLKALSQNHSSLSPINVRPSLTTMNTLQDHFFGQQNLNKNPSESILHLLFPKTRETEESINLHKDQFNKSIECHLQKNQQLMSGLDQNLTFSKRRSSNNNREGMHVKFKEIIKESDLENKQCMDLSCSILEIEQKNNTFQNYNYAKSMKSEYQANKKQNYENSSDTQALQNKTNVSKNGRQEKDEFEMSSQQSGQTGIQIQIKTIRTKLSNKKLSNSLWTLNFFGLICLVLILSMSFYQFSQMIKGLASIKFDLHFVDWPASVSSVCNGIWLQINLLLINDLKVFPRLSTEWPSYKQEIDERVYTLTKFGQLIYRDQIVSDYDIGWYFLDFTYRRNNFFMGRQDLPRTDMIKFQHRDPEVVFMQKYMANVYYYYLRVYETQEEQLMMAENYQELQRQLKLLSTQISESSISVDVYTLMIVTISLTFFQAILTIPIYLYIQNEREIILKLFSTLQKLSLDKMKNSCIESIENLTQVDIKKYLTQKSTTVSTNNQTNFSFKSTKRSSQLSISAVTIAQKTSVLQKLEQNTKKKLISTTSTIPKFHMQLSIIGLIFFGIICIQPIANALLVENFKQECKIIFLGLDSIFNMKDSLTKAISFGYGDIYSKLTYNQKNYLYNQTFFEKNIPSIIEEGKQRLIYLNTIATKIQQEQSDSKQYLKIISSLMQDNSCEIINKYPERHIIVNQIPFDYQKCLQSRNSIFKNGFQVASQYFLTQMSDLFEISSIQDETIRKSKFYLWEKEFDVHSFNEFYNQLSYIVGFAQKILLDHGYDRINEMWSTQIILTIAQILILILAFYIGWMNFFKFISRQLQSSRQIITLFEPESIIDNPYFMSYINKIT